MQIEAAWGNSGGFAVTSALTTLLTPQKIKVQFVRYFHSCAPRSISKGCLTAALLFIVIGLILIWLGVSFGPHWRINF